MEPTIDEVCTTYTWLVRHGYIAFKLVDGPLVVEGEYDGPEDPPPNEPLAREILTIMDAAPNGFLLSYQIVEAVLGREVTLDESDRIWMLTEAEPEGHA